MSTKEETSSDVARTTNGVFTPEQDNDKTNVEPVHSYDAFHTSRCRNRCERHNRNAQVQHLSCRCLVVVLLWCENTISLICLGI